jgi:hypothetical protein
VTIGRTLVATTGIGAVALLALVTSVLSSPAIADVTPSPSPVNIVVVIPGATSTATPTPSASSSGSHGGGGSSGGGTSTPGPSLPTEADGSPVTPNSPTFGLGGLKLDHETIEPHGLMTASGSGYAPGEKVKLVVYSTYTVIGNYTADAAGHFTAQFRIPDDLAPGEHVAEATGWDSRHVANKEFTVVTPAAAVGGIPFLWWLIVVVSVLLIGIVAALLYFRRSIGFWFGAASSPAGLTP